MSITTILSQLSQGMIISVEIFVLTLLFSLPLGLIVSFGRMSKNKILQQIVKIYIAIMRGTPLMLQLMAIYFAPYYLFGLKITTQYRFTAVIIAFSINYAAYFAEIYRGGIESMPIGQYEAAKILGYNKGQTFFKIILPQVIKRILPSITNETITLVKDTSLAMVISVAEMFTIAQRISARETSMFPLVIAGIFYFIFNYIVAFIMEFIEKKYRYAYINDSESEISPKMKSLFRDCVISVKAAQNLVVVKTLAGNGANAGAVVDKLNHEEIVGSVAGDDTLLVVCTDNAAADAVVSKIAEFIK